MTKQYDLDTFTFMLIIENFRRCSDEDAPLDSPTPNRRPR